MASFLATRPAAAQALGTYTGHSADGSMVSFTLTADSNTGKPVVTSSTIYFTAVCPRNIGTTRAGLGFGLYAPVLKKNGVHTATYKASLPSSSYEAFDLVFDTSNNTVTGDVTSVTPQLAKRSGTPTRSYVCTSASQSLTASLNTPAATPAQVSHTIQYAR